ncbi:MAG: JAB domain-containing protein, partial [Myxococcota bacterium]
MPRTDAQQSQTGRARTSSPITSQDDVYQMIRPYFVGAMQEIFLIMALDPRCYVVDILEVARGCLTHVEVHPREIFRPLIQQAAAYVVLAHNHPSGHSDPSEQDINLSY